MSAYTRCICGRKRGDHNDLVVRMRHCNRSAFNGYRLTISKYSQVICTRKGCPGSWRTKAKYVDELPDEDNTQNIV
jgi:hypothetical protein